jgi:serine/threonine-protein kinase
VGDDLGELALAIMGEEPIPISEHGAGDQALWHIVERGLDKDSQKRWSSMRAMGCELAAWLADNGVRTDITGAALEAHWLSDHSLRPFSDAPATVLPSAPVSALSAHPRRSRAVLIAGALAAAVLLSAAVWLLSFANQRDPSPDSGATPSSPTGAPRETPSASAPVDPTPSTSPDSMQEDGPAATSSASTQAASPTDAVSSAEPPHHAPKRQQAAPSDPGF